jgi:hypothetical protein
VLIQYRRRDGHLFQVNESVSQWDRIALTFYDKIMFFIQVPILEGVLLRMYEKAQEEEAQIPRVNEAIEVCTNITTTYAHFQGFASIFY